MLGLPSRWEPWSRWEMTRPHMQVGEEVQMRHDSDLHPNRSSVPGGRGQGLPSRQEPVVHMRDDKDSHPSKRNDPSER